MRLKQLLEQLNQLAKEKPEALEMEVIINRYDGVKTYSDFFSEQDLREQSLVMPYPFKHTGKPPLEKAIVIE